MFELATLSILFIYSYVHLFVCHLKAVPMRPKEGIRFLGAGITAAMSYLMWVLEIELGPSARTNSRCSL